MSATLEMIEPDLEKQAKLRENTKSIVADEGSEDEVPFKIEALRQLPLAIKVTAPKFNSSPLKNDS